MIRFCMFIRSSNQRTNILISKRGYRDSKSCHTSVGYNFEAKQQQQRKQMSNAHTCRSQFKSIKPQHSCSVQSHYNFLYDFARWVSKMAFGALAFFWPLLLLLLILRHHHDDRSLCWLCVAYLLNARFCFFHPSLPYIHFTSQLYIQHTQKARSQYQMYNGIFFKWIERKPPLDL